MPSSGLMVFWFVLVVAFIPLCLWLLKRSGLAAGTLPGSPALMKTVGQLNIGPGQRLVTVEVGSGDARTWLVLGVTAQQISTLHTMAPQVLPDAPQVGMASAFSSMLRRSSDALQKDPS